MQRFLTIIFIKNIENVTCYERLVAATSSHQLQINEKPTSAGNYIQGTVLHSIEDFQCF